MRPFRSKIWCIGSLYVALPNHMKCKNYLWFYVEYHYNYLRSKIVTKNTVSGNITSSSYLECVSGILQIFCWNWQYPIWSAVLLGILWGHANVWCLVLLMLCLSSYCACIPWFRPEDNFVSNIHTFIMPFYNVLLNSQYGFGRNHST